MSQEIIALAAEVREQKGKGISRALRRQDFVPAVIYGDKKEPLAIKVEEKLIARHAHKRGFFTQLFDLEIGGKKHRVLPRDVQFDPLTDRPVHADFLRVSASTVIRVAIPVIFTDADKSPGMKRGGTLNVVHHEITVACAPDKIPTAFTVSLDGLPINAAIHLSSIKFPEGVKPTTGDKEFTIATIAVPSGVRSDADEKAATPAAAAAAPAAGAKAPAAGAKAPAADAKAPAAKAPAKK